MPTLAHPEASLDTCPLGDQPARLKGSNIMRGLQHGHVFALAVAEAVDPRKSMAGTHTGSLKSALIQPWLRPQQHRALKIAATLW